MGVLQEFERRLEGAVEGFFARAFRSGLQPVELAKALQRYAEDNRRVTAGAVVVPNHYRIRLNPEDATRIADDPALARELGEVVRATAEERGWSLRGGALVDLDTDEAVRFGRYELAGRIDDAIAPPADPTPPPRPTEGATDAPEVAPILRVQVIGSAAALALDGTRLTVGRLPASDLVLDDPTVSREHAAFVRRGDAWWVLDLGSTNGTRVNGEPAAEQPIAPGDRIEFGEVAVAVRGAA